MYYTIYGLNVLYWAGEQLLGETAQLVVVHFDILLCQIWRTIAEQKGGKTGNMWVTHLLRAGQHGFENVDGRRQMVGMG